MRRKYSRCCFSAPLWTSSRIRLRTWSSARRSRWKASDYLEPLADVERLEQLHLLLVAEVRRVAGRVGQGARVGDRAQERADAVVGLAQLEDLLDDGAVLALEAADLLVAVVLVVVGRDLDPQRPVQVGASGAGDAAVEALEAGREGAAGKAQPLVDAGDRADRGELVIVAGDEQDLVLAAGIDAEGQVHPREDDDVVEGDQGQCLLGARRFHLAAVLSRLG